MKITLFYDESTFLMVTGTSSIVEIFSEVSELSTLNALDISLK